MADLHRPMYKVSFHGGLKGGWASDGGGCQATQLSQLCFYVARSTGVNGFMELKEHRNARS